MKVCCKTVQLQSPSAQRQQLTREARLGCGQAREWSSGRPHVRCLRPGRFPVQRPRRDHAGLGPSLQLSKEEAVEMQLNVRCLNSSFLLHATLPLPQPVPPLLMQGWSRLA